MEPWLWHLSEAWSFFYWEDFPLWDIPPLLLTEDWQATGEGWLDYVDRQAKELNITLTPSFAIEQEILAGRKVQMAIFGLYYPVDINRTEAGYVERASGTWSVSMGYDTGTGALLTRTWTEDVSLYYEYSGSLFIQQGSKSVSYSTEVASASFEFGEELRPPTLKITRVGVGATSVATGEDWLSYVAQQAEELNITLTPSFTIEQEILAGRKVEMAIFGLYYPVDINRTGAGWAERASGTWSVSMGYDTGTGALLTRTWTEDVDFYYYEHSGSLFIQEGSKSVSYSTEVASASFEFGEELQPPTLKITRVGVGATSVASGEAVAFDITVANEGDLNATGAVLYCLAPTSRARTAPRLTC